METTYTTLPADRSVCRSVEAQFGHFFCKSAHFLINGTVNAHARHLRDIDMKNAFRVLSNLLWIQIAWIVVCVRVSRIFLAHGPGAFHAILHCNSYQANHQT